MKKILLLLTTALACACAPKPQETPPVPEAEGTSAETAVSTPAAVAPPSGPAGYIRGQVNQIGKAKAAAALYEDTANKRMDPDLEGN